MSKTKASAATGSNAHSAPAPATTTTTTSTSTFTAASSGAGDANADSQAMLELSTDLTGLLISSTYAEAEGQAFECLLSDVRGRPRDLAFKLVLHPADEQGQQSVSYWPKIDKARDKEVDALLEEHFKTLMRFDRTQVRFYIGFLLGCFRCLGSHTLIKHVISGRSILPQGLAGCLQVKKTCEPGWDSRRHRPVSSLEEPFCRLFSFQ